jgi:NAD(P)-dependent dehydrogenase (short-subunit alcohol dehydrogenase family)
MPTMLITGASGQIGTATAWRAARAGWDVVANYRSNGDRAERLAADVSAETGRRVIAVGADVSLEEECLSLFETSIAEMGRIDCLVNNAGIAPGFGPFAELSVADIEVTWAVNLTGPFLCAREAVRHMSTARGGAGGSIVNVSSRAATIGSPFEWIHYASSKAGLDTLTTGLSKEVGGEGIRVNTVRPGLVVTDFGPWSPPGRSERLRSGVPLGRAGEPDEMAAAIVWLASDDASYVNGAFLDVGGGR